MDILLIPPLISLLSGIAILIWPRLLNYIVACYLILFGALGLMGQLQLGVRATRTDLPLSSSMPRRPLWHGCRFSRAMAVALAPRRTVYRNAQVSSGSFRSETAAGNTSAPLFNSHARLVPCTSSPNSTTP